MIQRYLGNKASIIDSIIEEVDNLCEKGDTVCDIFSGTMSVSLNLKLNGYNVISNDINSFSYVFGKSYLLNNEIPTINFESLKINPDDFIKDSKKIVATLDSNEKGYKFLKKKAFKSNFIDFINILQYLESLDSSSISKNYRESYFFNYYTEKGNESNFKSSRGSTGKRRYFSPENGIKLDNILNKIREWYQEKVIDDNLYYLLISVVLISVEKISNTQGTYHDFIRESYDSRALNTIKLLPPKFDFILSNLNGHQIGKERDSLDYIKEIPRHKVLYIDPPYNFRQYTSYYFMLNLISDYCKINDLQDYFNKTKFVRGQNMEKDFSSTFCKNALFISSLNELISNAETEWIIMSYYNGRNHKSGNNGDKEGILDDLDTFFNSDLFEEGSLQVKNIERTNYQSYGGHNAQKVNEILFIVKKNNI
ncbi:DNA adenine methylase [Flavobacteriaceae bacterium]|nr:DNA adenine methylase [Flavobacteriaceae bacterium]